MTWAQRRRPPSEYLPPERRAQVIADHGGICHLCGHEGAEQVDHLIGWAEWQARRLPPQLLHADGNLAPAHGRACPTCGVRCHEVKSKRERRAGIERRKLARTRQPEAHPGALDISRDA